MNNSSFSVYSSVDVNKKAIVLKLVVIGGGAAGFFAAITAKAICPNLSVIILEKTAQFLSRVRISGGGRCNVTHSCFDPKILVKNYPRGSRELLGPFYAFQPKDMIDWLKLRGVELKTEEDGRMFPVSDSSATIIDCFMKEAKDLGVETAPLTKIEKIISNDPGFSLITTKEEIEADYILLATGSSALGFEFAKNFEHTIKEPVPSLFTFNIPNFELSELSGVSMPNATVSFKKGKYSQNGPLLITHFGFSGPAALKLSAFCARELFSEDYHINLKVNWVSLNERQVFEDLLEQKKKNATLSIGNLPIYWIPKSLFRMFLRRLSIKSDSKLCDCSQKDLMRLSVLITSDSYEVKGKATNKSEFVTCGGVDLKEVNFNTMESKITKGLYFAGEVLDIDGITGGFNFQSAWTTGYIAGISIAKEANAKIL